MENIVESFETATEYIEQEIKYRNDHSFFIVITATIIIGMAVWIFLNSNTALADKMYYKFLGAGIFGMFGAILSLLSQRKKGELLSKSAKDSVNNSIHNIIYGFLAGNFILLFILGDVVLGIANNKDTGERGVYRTQMGNWVARWTSYPIILRTSHTCHHIY